MAKANSSASKRPSLSTSANFHMLASTELGNLVLRNSSLAAEKKLNLKTILPLFSYLFSL